MVRHVELNLVGVSHNYDLLPSEMAQLIAVKDSTDRKFSLSRFSLLFLSSLNVHGSRATEFFLHYKVGWRAHFRI